MIVVGDNTNNGTNYGDSIAASLIAFGVTAIKLTELETAVDNFKNIIQDPKDERAQSTAAGAKVEKLIVETDEVLEIIDSLMATQSQDFEFLYLHYLNTRKIDDDNGGGSPQLPDFTVVLNPMVFTVGFDLPYVGSQRIRVTNLGTEIVQWGLSTIDTGFSGATFNLGLNETSNYLSSTLGPNGNYLMLLNQGAAPTTVEIKLLDE